MPDPPVPAFAGKQPPFLKAGDLVGITCPASPVEAKEMEKTKTLLTRWGLEVCVGRTVGNVWQRFAGTDPERTADLQLMINDPQVKAILFARGGYGAMRIMDKIDWSPLAMHPKWLVGYSDITAFHCLVHTHLALATIHGNMAASFKEQEDGGTKTIRELLSGIPVCHEAEAHDKNRMGTARGLLVGGNLSLVAAMLGSKSALDTSTL
jgi:muramoyltetrapeptide carboxypeptidase